MGCGISRTTAVASDFSTQMTIPVTNHRSGLQAFKRVAPFSKSHSNNEMSSPICSDNSLANNNKITKEKKVISCNLPLLIRKNKNNPDNSKCSSTCIITVQPNYSNTSIRQISDCSQITGDSGFTEDTVPGDDNTTITDGDRDLVQIITENSNRDTVMEVMMMTRPVTPDMCVEGVNLYNQHKSAPELRNCIPGQIDSTADTANPMPPLSSKSTVLPEVNSNGNNNNNNNNNNMNMNMNKDSSDLLSQTSFIIERPPSRGGLAFDVIMDNPITRKNNSLAPIMFESNNKFSKKRSTKLTKAQIDEKLFAADQGRKEKEHKILPSLSEQRLNEENRMKKRGEIQTEQEELLEKRIKIANENHESQQQGYKIRIQKEVDRIENIRMSKRDTTLDATNDNSILQPEENNIPGIPFN